MVHLHDTRATKVREGQAIGRAIFSRGLPHCKTVMRERRGGREVASGQELLFRRGDTPTRGRRKGAVSRLIP